MLHADAFKRSIDNIGSLTILLKFTPPSESAYENDTAINKAKVNTALIASYHSAVQ